MSSTGNPFVKDVRQEPQARRRFLELEKKLFTAPQTLKLTAGHDSCSIFRVPVSFADINGKYSHPRIVSIGPFHHGEHHLQMIQEHKYHYLSVLLSRTELTLEDLFQTLYPIEDKIRECYSEEIHFDRDQFVELLVVDGCFIIELFRKTARLFKFDYNDPIFSMAWIFPFLVRDLIRLENQVPFFVLQKLFDRTRGISDSDQEDASLVSICFNFFAYFVERPDQVVERLQNFEAKHLLDLYRSSFISKDVEKSLSPSGGNSEDGNELSHVIHCTSKLRRAGIKLRPPRSNDSESFLAVKFLGHGVIEMPTVTIDDFMTTFFANCVAFELCHYKAKTYFSAYTTLLACLIKTHKDAEYLSGQNVIENYLGTDEELANFINSLGNEVAFDPSKSYLLDLFKQVNIYYKNNWHLQWASLKYIYFNTPWSFISALAAFVLLVLSILQTLYTVIGYYKQQEQNEHAP